MSKDGLPSILNRSTAQKLLRETLTPQTVRQCEDTAPLGAASNLGELEILGSLSGGPEQAKL